MTHVSNAQQIKKCSFSTSMLTEHVFCFIINMTVGREVNMTITETTSTFCFWNHISKNIEQLLVPWPRRAGSDSIFDLFQPLYSAASSSNSTQIQLGHNNGSKLMQWWMKSSSLFHFQHRRTWWSKMDTAKTESCRVTWCVFQQQIVVWLKVVVVWWKQHVFLSSAWKWKPSWQICLS